MKVEDCIVGYKVAPNYSHKQIGEVIMLKDGCAIIDYGSYIDKVDIEKLILAEDALKILEEEKQKQAKLEAEFAQVKAECQDKLRTAVKLVEEVAMTLNEHDKESYCLGDAYNEFEAVLQDTGWVPSMVC